MKFLYWLFGYCYHDWTKYSDIIREEWTAVNIFINKRDNFIRSYQTRHCNKCGLAQSKDVKN